MIDNAPVQPVVYQDLGTIEYRTCLEVQRFLFKKTVHAKLDAKRSGRKSETTHYLLTCNHPHVYTLGKSGSQSHLLVAENGLAKLGASFCKTDRGGDITYHGPGQIVGYPILDLDRLFTDVGKYIRLIEQVIIDTLADFDVLAAHYPGYTGVWIEPGIPEKERKIAAIGLHISRWVTMHGFALNVNTDLSYFNHIVPCGIGDKKVTSLSQELGVAASVKDVLPLLCKHFEKLFAVKLHASPIDLRAGIPQNPLTAQEEERTPSRI